MIVAIDIGTSSSKGCGFDSKTLRPITPWVRSTGTKNEVENKPNEYSSCPLKWMDACVEILNAVAEEAERTPSRPKPVLVALSGMMQNVILPLETENSCVLYSDASFAKAAHESMVRDCSEAVDAVKRATGNYKDAASIVAKLVQFNLNDRVKKDSRRVLFGAHSYVAWRLMGGPTDDASPVWLCDATTASTTGLVDRQTGEWIDQHLRRRLTIDNFALPTLLPDTGNVVGVISSSSAKALNTVFDGVSLVHGAGDLGSLICAVDTFKADTHAYLGTSGWIARVVPRNAVVLGEANQLPVFRLAHPTMPALKVIEAMPTTGAGLNIAKWTSTLFGASDPAILDQHAARAMSSNSPSQSVLYLPYLRGERAPVSMGDATACFLGMTTETTKEDLALAVLTGVAYQFRWLSESLQLKSEELVLLGGGSRSRVWRQIMADVLNKRIKSLEDEEFDETVFGAASVGLRALEGEQVCSEIGLNWSVTMPSSDDAVRRRHDTNFVVWKRAALLLKDLYSATPSNLMPT